MSLSVPKEALVTKQPTAEQTATIRGAYANANIPAETTTSIIQNPASASTAYGNIAQASQPTPSAPTTQTTSVPTPQPSNDFGLSENFATKVSPGRVNLTPGLIPGRYVTSDYGLSENIATKISPGRANLAPGLVTSQIFTVTEPMLTNTLGRRVKPLTSTTTETVEQQFPERNPLAARTLLGGLQITGSDIQNLFAGAASNLSARAAQTQAQNLASTRPNTTSRFIGSLLPGAEFEAAGFYQSLGLVTGKFGNVQTNVATVGGFGVGLATQALIGGEVYGAAKGALGITSLGRSIAFGSTTFAGINAGLTAVQGGSPTQIAESAFIGGALGGGSEALAGALRPLARSSFSVSFPQRAVSTSPSISLSKQVSEVIDLGSPEAIDFSKATLANVEETSPSIPSTSSSLGGSSMVYSTRSGQALLQENIQLQRTLEVPYTSTQTARTIAQVSQETALTAQLTKLLIAARIRGIDIFAEPQYLTYPSGSTQVLIQRPSSVSTSFVTPSLGSDYIQSQLLPQRQSVIQRPLNVQTEVSRQIQNQVQLERLALVQQTATVEALGLPIPTRTRTKQRKKKKAKPKKRRYKEITERIPFERVLFG